MEGVGDDAAVDDAGHGRLPAAGGAEEETAVGADQQPRAGERKREGEDLLNNLMSECERQFGIRPGAHLREGAVGEEIIHIATNDSDVIMVVIGIAHASGARGSLASWLAAQLGTKLPIPLLMVPGNLTHQQLAQLI